MLKPMKYVVWGLLLVTLQLTGMVLWTHATEPSSSIQTPTATFVDDLLFNSSRYTQVETVDTERLFTYYDDYFLHYTDTQLETLGFEKMFETEALAVYFEKDSFSMVIENKLTGYFWSSRPEFQGMSGSREDNSANRNLMNSGLWVDYLRTTNINASAITTASLYTLAGVKYVTDGSIKPEQSDPTHPYQITAGSYDSSKVATSITNQNATSFTVHVALKAIQMEFDIVLSLVNDQLEVLIPNESIKELGDNFRLLSIQVFPYFGAAREDKIPGYVVIPDGVGALVRTNRAYNTYFSARFYGDDVGYQATTVPQLSVPIYGMVHEVNANGYYVNIVEGSENSSLLANFWGSSTRYHRISSRFNVRQLYFNVINKAGDGSDALPVDMVSSNYRISYHLLSNNHASYVGMANDYRQTLIDEGVLTSREASEDNHIPIELSYLLADQEPSFFGTSEVTMTTLDQVQEAYDYFYDEGLTNQEITLLGWSHDGATNRQPYNRNFIDAGGISELSDQLHDDGNSLYFANDYTISTSLSSRISYNDDVAKNLSKLKIELLSRSLIGDDISYYWLYPENSLALAQEDVTDFLNLGADGLALSNLGNVLFSYYDDAIYDRSQSIETYRSLAALYPSLHLDQPNAYLFDYVDGYRNMPITNSQYDYYTDLVPLIPIILKGSISYYTPYLNFNALGQNRLLTMVDFAINPSYLLTHEATSKMRYTPSNVFFTTALSDFDEEVVNSYHYVNDALKYVIGASIISRTMLLPGVAKVIYSNGVTIYINYTSREITVDNKTLNAEDYEVVLP